SIPNIDTIIFSSYFDYALWEISPERAYRVEQDSGFALVAGYNFVGGDPLPSGTNDIGTMHLSFGPSIDTQFLTIEWHTLDPVQPLRTLYPDTSLYPLIISASGVPGSPSAPGSSSSQVFLTQFTPVLLGVASCCSTPGYPNSDSNVNISDVTFLISRIFAGGQAPVCADQADANGASGVNIADVTYLIARIFAGGPAPVCGTTGFELAD
ncbi:MAG: hypothetical protein IH914_04115, partial [candidate division Zixibacteria bacterium]|nr:hypothetical protein [candidate division Zixibacteria bacterium]